MTVSIVPRRRQALPAGAHHPGPPRGPAREPLVARVLRRVLEGPHTWGELDVFPSRYGYTSYALVVHPPGATRSERIRFRLLRAWPPVGMLLGLAGAMAAARTLPLPLALALGLAVYGAGALGLAVVAGPNRRLVRELRTCRGDEAAGAPDRGAQRDLEELAALLLDAEAACRDGRIDAVMMELVHGEVWQRLDSPRLRERR